MALLTIDLTGYAGLTSGASQLPYKTIPEPHLNYLASEGEMVSGVYNPLMRPGYLYPANNSFLTLDVPAITDEFKCALADPEIGLVIGSEDENFYTFDTTFTVGPTTYTYSKLDGVKIEAIGANSGNVNDVEVYQVNGSRRLFYVSDSNVGIATTSLGSPDRDWLSTVCLGGAALSSSGVNAFLRKSDNGLLYVFDEYTIHSIDGNATGGANGTANMNVLTFPEDMFEIADAVDTRGKLFIALNNSTTSHTDFSDKTFTSVYTNECGVYVWNRLSTIISMQDYISVESCQRINRIWVGPDGNIFINTIGTNGNNQIRVFDGGKFTLIKELPFESKISQRDGLIVAEGMTIWAGVDGFIYAGRFEGSNFFVFKLAQYFSGTLSGAAGTVITYLGGNEFSANTGYRTTRPSLVIAYRPNGQNAVVKRYFIYGIDSMTDANGSDSSGFITPNPFTFSPNQGDVFTGVKILPTMSTIRTSTIRCLPTAAGSGTIATIKYYFNQSSTVGMTKTVTLDEASKGYVVHHINKPYVNSIQMEIEWNTSTTMGVNDFAPYVAIIDYDVTSTNSPDNG